MQFTKRDKELFEMLKSQKYKAVIDNDCVTVEEINPFAEDTEEWKDFDGFYESFSSYGQEFIEQLLIHIGIKAEPC